MSPRDKCMFLPDMAQNSCAIQLQGHCGCTPLETLSTFQVSQSFSELSSGVAVMYQVFRDSSSGNALAAFVVMTLFFHGCEVSCVSPLLPDPYTRGLHGLHILSVSQCATARLVWAHEGPRQNRHLAVLAQGPRARENFFCLRRCCTVHGMSYGCSLRYVVVHVG